MAIVENGYVGGFGGFGAYTPRADDIIKLTKLAKEEYGIALTSELFEYLLDIVYGEAVLVKTAIGKEN